MLLPPQQQQQQQYHQQQYQYSTRNTEFTVHMESQPHSLRRTRSPQEPVRDNNNNNNNMNTAVAAASDATLEEEEEKRLQSVLHQLNEKQVPPTSHHGLTILITGANRYVASSKHRRNTHPSATHNIISFSLSLPSSDL